MNAVEIEEAVSNLVQQPFDPEQFPFAFLEAFGNNPVTIKRLQAGTSNRSDVAGAVLQRNNIHIASAAPSEVGSTLARLRASPTTAAQKAKFILATDGDTLEAEDLTTGETLACAFTDLPTNFGFFLQLAGFTTVKQIRENTIDIRATGSLNKLYIELLKQNPEWSTEQRRDDMNHFMARLIFCFFAEDTGIFSDSKLFTTTILNMSAQDSNDTHEVIAAIFNAMARSPQERKEHPTPTWAAQFPYVNGGLFSKIMDIPKFSRTARSYLSHVGRLPWQEVNPDIFGSMIQAIVEDDERGSLGMHYTSVPNILKVLNPLFLDNLRQQLTDAGENKRKLINLRNRMSKIRVFDPAAGSGNFLVIAYKQMREIEAEINRRRGESDRASEIRLTNFRGIEIKSFSAEIARLALIIAEYQCDVLHRSYLLAQQEFLPLKAENWITCGNALHLDWLKLFPPTGKETSYEGVGLFPPEHDQSAIDFENEGGETYIASNPPYRGSKWQSGEQKTDMLHAWERHPKLAKTTDYVTGWIARFMDYADAVPNAVAGLVATNSICQGQQASEIWPVAFARGFEIPFAHTSFTWRNLASHNAGVTVVIVGLTKKSSGPKWLYEGDQVRECRVIGPYLVPDSDVTVTRTPSPIGQQAQMLFGNMPRDGGHLLLSPEEARELKADPRSKPFVRKFVGSDELISGRSRYCLWIDDDKVDTARAHPEIAARLEKVAANRLESRAESTRSFAQQPHRFVQIAGTASQWTIAVPGVSSETREYLPCDLLPADSIMSNKNFALYDAPLWNFAVVASRLHLVWIATVCVRMRTDFSYSNTLGWNTFPLPKLTEKNRQDLTQAAEDILLARESHFPATIADLYTPDKMPDNLRRAHERNDEIIERIFIGRRFKNDTERLENLFSLYQKSQPR